MAKPKKFFTREDILMAMRNTKSNAAAARFLRCSLNHYRMYAKMYTDEETGLTLYELHKNQGGVGLPKFALHSPTGGRGRGKRRGGRRPKNPPIMDILEGRVPIEHFNPQKIKYRLIELGMLKAACAQCGFKEKRLEDGKSPLILHHKDGDKKNWRLPNLEFLCYNCTFLNGGSDCPVTEEFVEKAEEYLDRNTSSEISKTFELDDYQQEYLKNLGIPDPKEKKKDSKYEYVSRL